MSITTAIIVPHPPLIIPKVGLGQENTIYKTIEAYHEAVKKVTEHKPETLIVLTPHGEAYADYFYIRPGKELSGNLKEFGSPDVISAVCDNELRDELCRICNVKGFPAGTLSHKHGEMDHGVYVPLYFVNQHYTDYKILCISTSGLSLREHYVFGMLINEAVENTGRNAAIIASGDLSHKLQNFGPYGYAKEGPALDRAMTDTMCSGCFNEFLEIDENIRQKGAECGLGSIAAMSGVLNKKEVDINFLSYEGPFGVGYAVSAYSVIGDDENRDFLKIYDDSRIIKLKELREAEDEYVKLARNTLEHYIKTRRLMKMPSKLPEDMLNNKAGTFVSIKKHGKLRGCIGTLEPTTENMAMEIMYNAISAGTRDPRFPEIEEDELTELIYSIDVLFPPEPVEDLSELDPIKYGIIVSNEYKRGVLLPDLPEVDTVEEQLKIALSKAGIGKKEKYVVEKFEVARHI